jgi:hypothetical protein
VAEWASGADGSFRGEVPAGSYYVDAEGLFEGRPLFAFPGFNPLRLESGERWIGLKAVARASAVPFDAPPGTAPAVEGIVTHGGAPVEDAVVYAYEGPASRFKGMGVGMAPPTGADGLFRLEGLAETAWWIVARKRGGGGATGPLGKGDLYGFFPGNPVSLAAGKGARVEVELVEKEKELSYSDVTAGAETVLSGRVTDRAGAPQAGVYAFVYEDRVFGHQRPGAHSGRTSADGTFVIYLDRPGTWYLGARENFGNSPRPGERVGFYDGTPDHSVTVGEGEKLRGLSVVVEPILEDRP